MRPINARLNFNKFILALRENTKYFLYRSIWATFGSMDPIRHINHFRFNQLATQLRRVSAVSCHFLSLQYRLGDSFLKSSKDFIK